MIDPEAMAGPSDAALDAALRRSFEGPVADEGFSTRVMQVLPARRRRLGWLPGMTLLGAALTGITLAPSSMWGAVTAEWQSGAFGTASAAACVLLLAMSLLSCGWALDDGA